MYHELRLHLENKQTNKIQAYLGKLSIFFFFPTKVLFKKNNEEPKSPRNWLESWEDEKVQLYTPESTAGPWQFTSPLPKPPVSLQLSL